MRMKKLLGMMVLVGATMLTGCGSDNDDFVFTGPDLGVVIEAPVCADDAYVTNQNTALAVTAANGVIANDTTNGATLTFPASTAQGGTISNGLADGSFTYTPATNFSGTDTFTYTLGNSGGVETCTVTITVSAVDGFFVDATNGNDGTGAFTNGLPFASIQAALTAAGTNQDIVVRAGTYTGNVTLLDGQRLLGSGSTLATNPDGTARPIINSAGVTLADGNTVDFVRIQNTPGSDAITASGTNGATITNNEISGTTGFGNGIGDDRATGTWTITDNTITATDSIGIFLRGTTGDNLVAVIQDNDITNNAGGGIAFSSSGTGTVRAQVTGNTMTGTTNAGATFEVTAFDTANLCFDITGNTNDDSYDFDASNASAIEVEQLSQLLTLNSGTAVLDNPSGGIGGPATEVADGTCGF